MQGKQIWYLLKVCGTFVWTNQNTQNDLTDHKFHMVNSVTCMNVGTSLEKAIK